MIRGLAQYRLLRRLGEGGQAEVYLAFDTRLKRRVCIKLYYLTGSLASRRRAVLEARHLMQVTSLQTVDIYDVVSAGTRLALVVQFVPGCTLEELLRSQGCLPPANAMALVTDLTAALAALRQAGVVHGDMKPSNVLVNDQGRALLGDFGASQLVGEPWSVYSRESLSPEQSRGETSGLSSDFFALGLLLYRMLFGKHPFYANGELDLRQLRAGLEDIPKMSGLSPAAVQAVPALLRSLLAAHAEARPKGTFELREQLRDVRSGLPAPTAIEIPLQALVHSPERSLGRPRLPRKLVRVPFGQQAKAWLADYWSRGSFGARGLLMATVLAPLVVVALHWAAPGPCVAITMPQINVQPGTRSVPADAQELWILLSTLFKDQADKAVVLGAGAASDSRYTLSAAGMHNSCIAQRQLNLEIDCAAGRCLLQLRGERGDSSVERQLSLPQTASRGDLAQALTQLVQEQAGFLMN
ncbi:serine/threonine-protein kinase [Congregibacter sp.]|uniref:serine/threonine-protein kinase n=1 Tax=Congregibacter sp. TaxID=2744308 RepID=UPI003F6C6406